LPSCCAAPGCGASPARPSPGTIAPPGEWWSGPASGVATMGRIIASQDAATISDIRRHFDALTAEFAGTDGSLMLPHAALLEGGYAAYP
jgi:hypothetical protein